MIMMLGDKKYSVGFFKESIAYGQSKASKNDKCVCC